ncbi:MAG: hypothetical protein ABEJ96_09195, partial [Thiohalorhabdaceae bacterium]
MVQKVGGRFRIRRTSVRSGGGPEGERKGQKSLGEGFGKALKGGGGRIGLGPVADGELVAVLEAKQGTRRVMVAARHGMPGHLAGGRGARE